MDSLYIRFVFLVAFFGCVAEPVPISGRQERAPDAAVIDEGTDVSLPSDMSDPTSQSGNDALADDSDALADDSDVLVDDSDVSMDISMPDTQMSDEDGMAVLDGSNPSDICIGQTPGTVTAMPTAGAVVESPKLIGATQPIWTLQDLQPQSCGFEDHYGLQSFRTRPLVVILLWDGCGFCRTQTEKLQEMRFEMLEAGIDVDFAIVNRASDSADVTPFVERCDFPIFQDVESVDAWGLHDGAKDDFYFYTADGILFNFMSPREPLSINLSTEEGYGNVWSAVVALAQNDGQDIQE